MPRAKPINDELIRHTPDLDPSRTYRYTIVQDGDDAITLKGRAPWPREQWKRT